MAAPPNFDWSAPAISAEVDAILAQTTRVWDRVGEIPLENATFKNTILPIAQDQNEHLWRYNVVRWFASVSSHDDIRAASNEARKRVMAFRKGLWQRRDVAEAVLKIWSDQQKSSCLDAESMLYLNVLRQEFVNSGLALKDPKSVSRLADLEGAIKKAAFEYSRALDGKQGLWMAVDELQGVPDSAVLSWEADQDKRFVPFRVATFEMLLKHADREKTRKKFEMAYDNQAKDTNPALLHPILVLSGPVQSRIDAFLEIKASQPRENHSPASQLDKIYTWDAAYYKRLCREQQYAVDEAAMQEYFPFGQVLDQVLKIQGAAFGFRFEKVDAQYPRDVWHQDVETYKVWKEEGQEEFVGYFYVDAYARDFKFGHGISASGPRWISNLPQHRVPRELSQALKPRQVCAPHIPPSRLLLPRNRALVSQPFQNHKVLGPRHCGPRFRGIPSILLEHFFWHVAAIRFVSGRRAADGGEEKLPDSAIEGLIASRFAGDVMAKSRLVRDGLADLRMHMPASHEDAVQMDPVREYNRARREMCRLAGPEDAGMELDSSKAVSRMRSSLRYPASYYAYFLAGAISYDLFETKFRPLMPASDAVTVEQLITPELKKECRRWQRMILEPGGRLAGRYMEAIAEYLGREATVDAWIEQSR